ncbi:hypothetical protein [Lelliottia sp. RWM.1]|uniref:hypothetical protein n=1 Tax=Lelliottia sp. RWM.1 TaxID=2663242 RepID=UPI00193D4B37|nr:hypothetical protein [Lelliottia sp. RWM.1]MBM3069874.1 hypothetical protein [Lelliottia sp. RWM.1]
MEENESLLEDQWVSFFIEVVLAVKKDYNCMDYIFTSGENILGLSDLIRLNRTGPTVYPKNALLFLEWIENFPSKKNIKDKFDVIALYFIIDIGIGSDSFWNNCNIYNIPKLFYSTAREIINSSSTSIDYNCATDFHNKEKMESVKNIVIDNNWYSIYNEFYRSSHIYKAFLSPYIKNAVDFLFYYSRLELIELLDTKKDVPVLWGVFEYFGADVALELALSTNSNCINFYTISSIFPFNGNNQKTFDGKSMVYLLLNIFNDFELTRHIMKIFNTYPLRYPYLQQFLGKALASKESELLIKLYFDSISLSLSDSTADNASRKAVSECMRVLSLHATDLFRKSCWRIAHEIWGEWLFVNKNNQDFIHGIKVCEIDFAITMYYIECCTSNVRELEITKLIGEMSDFSSQWFKSSSEMISYWYIRLSILQPIFHAQNSLNNIDDSKVMIGITYMPNCFRDNEYIYSMLRG